MSIIKKLNSLSWQNFIFQPGLILSFSLIAASLYALFATFKFSGDKLVNQYYYVTPIIIPFVVFLFERLKNFRQALIIQKLIDAIVIVIAMWRVIGDVPYISGHALFLTYAILKGYSLLGRISATIVMIEVIYLKIFIWNDWLSLIGGILLGTIAFLMAKRFSPNLEIK
jgi:hypothetical protein